LVLAALLAGLAWTASAKKIVHFHESDDGSCENIRKDIERSRDNWCVMSAASRKTGSFKASIVVSCLISVILGSTSSWFLATNKVFNGRNLNFACLGMSFLGTLGSIALAIFSGKLGWKSFLNSVCECERQSAGCFSEAQKACWKESSDVFFGFEEEHAGLIWLPVGFGTANILFTMVLCAKLLSKKSLPELLCFKSGP